MLPLGIPIRFTIAQGCVGILAYLEVQRGKKNVFFADFLGKHLFVRI